MYIDTNGSFGCNQLMIIMSCTVRNVLNGTSSLFAFILIYAVDYMKTCKTTS